MARLLNPFHVEEGGIAGGGFAHYKQGKAMGTVKYQSRMLCCIEIHKCAQVFLYPGPGGHFPMS